MRTDEITLQDLNAEQFIEEKVKEISSLVGSGTAINALSGGVDSSAVTMLGHKALGKRLKTYFIENGLMRKGEPQKIVELFKSHGIEVILLDAKEEAIAHGPEDLAIALTERLELIRTDSSDYMKDMIK
jgi:GMP synthase (glutamine-hydrolysing)